MSLEQVMAEQCALLAQNNNLLKRLLDHTEQPREEIGCRCGDDAAPSPSSPVAEVAPAADVKPAPKEEPAPPVEKKEVTVKDALLSEKLSHDVVRPFLIQYSKQDRDAAKKLLLEETGVGAMKDVPDDKLEALRDALMAALAGEA